MRCCLWSCVSGPTLLPQVFAQLVIENYIACPGSYKSQLDRFFYIMAYQSKYSPFVLQGPWLPSLANKLQLVHMRQFCCLQDMRCTLKKQKYYTFSRPTYNSSFRIMAQFYLRRNQSQWNVNKSGNSSLYIYAPKVTVVPRSFHIQPC